MSANPRAKPYRQRLAAKGLCKRCGKPKGPRQAMYLCQPCASKATASFRDLRKRRIANHLCAQCAAPLVPNWPRQLCLRCTERMRASTDAWLDRKRIAAGRARSNQVRAFLD